MAARRKKAAPESDAIDEFLAHIADTRVLDEAMGLLVNYRPHDLDSFIHYVSTYYGVDLATKTGCTDHGHVPPGVVWWEHFNDEVMDSIIIGSRESGKTNGYAILDHLQAHFNGDEIANVGAVEAQAKKCYSYIKAFCQLPHFRGQLAKAPMLSETHWLNGGKVEIMPATVNRVNSPHPRIANWDEVELTTYNVLDEGISMPVRQKGRPPAVRYTSSRKKAYGPLETLLGQAKERGLKVYIWCVFDVIKTCPPERHKQGVGCRGDKANGVPGCPLAEDCLYSYTDEAGDPAFRPGPGRAAFADGWMEIDDVIRQKRLMNNDVWDSQWLSKRASSKGLIYPDFEESRHVIASADYDWNPALPVYAGMDFGFTNPTAVIYAQMLPTDELIIFAEDYESGIITPQWGRRIKRTPWYNNIQWIASDPAAADARNTLIDAGLPMISANNEVTDGIARVRYLLKPPLLDYPMIYWSERCVNSIAEAKQYHIDEAVKDKDPKEDPSKAGDHAMDATRYLVSELYGDKIAV